jgi:hypothetical protein
MLDARALLHKMGEQPGKRMPPRCRARPAASTNLLSRLAVGCLDARPRTSPSCSGSVLHGGTTARPTSRDVLALGRCSLTTNPGLERTRCRKVQDRKTRQEPARRPRTSTGNNTPVVRESAPKGRFSFLAPHVCETAAASPCSGSAGFQGCQCRCSVSAASGLKEVPRSIAFLR